MIVAILFNLGMYLQSVLYMLWLIPLFNNK